MAVDPKPTEISHKQQDGLKLTEQYIGLLILVFNNAGLVDVSALCCGFDKWLT